MHPKDGEAVRRPACSGSVDVLADEERAGRGLLALAGDDVPGASARREIRGRLG